jgi:hypothetical protein
MIATIVQFNVSGRRREDLLKVFDASIPTYQKVPGLIRKYYVLSEDGQTAGGIYLWRSRGDAEALYTDQWRQMIEGKYGSRPTVTFFEASLVLDNQHGEVSR